MKFFGKKSQSGFSLVELMIVVGIIGVLATLALPRFKQFQAKAKMAEAMNVLQHVYTLEQSYSLDNNQFVAFNGYGANLTSASGGNTTCTTADPARALLGLVIEPCVVGAPTPRFQYSVAFVGGNTGTFNANAVTGTQANNRICAGNNAFAITLSHQNAASWGPAAPGATAGNAPINTVCAL